MGLVAGDDLMTIGRFAHISGLSVHTLRHYDDVGLLTPAEIDQATSYRRYRRSQVRDARIIQALRWLDVPIEEIKDALADSSGAGIRTVLSTQRRRLELHLVADADQADRPGAVSVSARFPQVSRPLARPRCQSIRAPV